MGRPCGPSGRPAGVGGAACVCLPSGWLAVCLAACLVSVCQTAGGPRDGAAGRLRREGPVAAVRTRAGRVAEPGRSNLVGEVCPLVGQIWWDRSVLWSVKSGVTGLSSGRSNLVGQVCPLVGQVCRRPHERPERRAAAALSSPTRAVAQAEAAGPIAACVSAWLPGCLVVRQKRTQLLPQPPQVIVLLSVRPSLHPSVRMSVCPCRSAWGSS